MVPCAASWTSLQICRVFLLFVYCSISHFTSLCRMISQYELCSIELNIFWFFPLAWRSLDMKIVVLCEIPILQWHSLVLEGSGTARRISIAGFFCYCETWNMDVEGAGPGFPGTPWNATWSGHWEDMDVSENQRVSSHRHHLCVSIHNLPLSGVFEPRSACLLLQQCNFSLKNDRNRGTAEDCIVQRCENRRKSNHLPFGWLVWD